MASKKRSGQRRLQQPETPQTANEIFLDAMIRHMIGLQLFSGSLSRQTHELLDAVEADIRGALRARIRRPGARTPAQIRQLERVLNEIEKLRSQAWDDVNALWREELTALALAEPKFVSSIIQTSVPVVLRPKLPTAEQMRAIVTSHSFLGQTLSGHLRKIRQSDLDRLEAQVRIGLVQGETGQQIARRLVGTVRLRGANGTTAVTRHQATALARTSVSAIAHAATREFAGKNLDIVSRDLFVATLDSRTTPICVVGSTPVQPIGLLRRIYRRRYSGDVIVVGTAAGKKLVGTPNHPILTPNGWLPLEKLQPGKQVVYTEPLKGRGVVGVQDVAMPSTAAEIFDAADDPSFCHILRESPSATNFHGDGVGSDGEIDILVPKCPLRLTLYLRGFEQVEEDSLSGVHSPARFDRLCLASLLDSRGSPALMASKRNPVSVQDAIDDGLRSVELIRDRRRIHASFEHLNHPGTIGLDSVVALSTLKSWSDTSLEEKARNCGRSGFVVGSDRPGGPPASIRGDDVVSVRREFRSTHVYNFETCRGVFLANSIVTHNCQSLDGETFPIEDPFPNLPLHYNERSRRVPLLDPEPLGKRPMKPVTQRMLLREFTSENGLEYVSKRAKLPFGTKGKFDAFARKRTRELIGRTPAKTSYEEFLRRQPASFQDDPEILGPTRGRLFRRGGLSLDRFVERPSGRRYTISELARREEAAFRAAGLDPEEFLRAPSS